MKITCVTNRYYDKYNEYVGNYSFLRLWWEYEATQIDNNYRIIRTLNWIDHVGIYPTSLFITETQRQVQVQDDTELPKKKNKSNELTDEQIRKLRIINEIEDISD